MSKLQTNKSEELIFGHSLEQIEALDDAALLKAFAPQILAEPPMQIKPSNETAIEDEDMEGCPIKKRKKTKTKAAALAEKAMAVTTEDLE